MEEISAGGVIVDKRSVLFLKKYRGDWVLPKGRVEDGETFEETALREVREESGLECEIGRYIGFVKYNYMHYDGEEVQKTVHYFYMKKPEGEICPQKEEGFCDAAFMPAKTAMRNLRHRAERAMVERAFDFARKERKKRR